MRRYPSDGEAPAANFISPVQILGAPLGLGLIDYFMLVTRHQ